MDLEEQMDVSGNNRCEGPKTQDNDRMDVDQVLDVSHLYTSPTSLVAAKWLKYYQEHDMSKIRIRDQWRIWVPRAFMPELNTSCLEWRIKDDLVHRELIDPLEQFICNGNQEAIFKYLNDVENSPIVCGKVFKMGEPTYNCRDCGMDPTCVLCLDCFKLSEHKNHKYKMGTSSGGGCCDCGDVEAWKTSPYCSTHAQGLKKNGCHRFAQDLEARVNYVFSDVLYYVYQVLTLEYSPGLPLDLRLKEEDIEDPLNVDADLYCTVLYNDETHTFEQVNSEEVINTLSRVIKCSQRDAIEFVTNIDREGRAVVKSSTFQHCTELKIDIERFTSRNGTRPLKVLVVHAYVVAHQMFALRLLTWLQKIVGITEAFRNVFTDVVLHHRYPDMSCGSILEFILVKDYLLWKSARLHWHRILISGMFMEYDNKKAFATVFTRHYGTVLKDFIRDDHDHGFSIASLSIQVFPVPTLAQYLIAYHDVLFVLLNTFISECSRKCNKVGKLEFDRASPTGPFRRAIYILYDLRYLLGSPPTTWTDDLRKGFLQGVSLILTLLTYMQGMDSVTRQVGQHLEYEPEWESAFNLHIKLAPVITLVLKWCSTDRVVLIKAYRLTLKKLFENPSFDPSQPGVVRELADHSVPCLLYDVSTQPVSIHLPLTRFLAGLHLHLEKYGLTFDSQDFYHLTKHTTVQIIEPVLRTQVMIAQVHAGMWRRNGYSLSNQIYFYHNVKCRGEMLDKDIVLLQMGASLIESNEFLIHTLNKYSLLNWALEDFEINYTKNSEEDTMKQTINMVEEFLSLLIIIIGERYVPGVGKVTPDECLKNEIIHQLFIRPLSHSEMNRSLVDDINHETGMERVINEVATYKKQVSGKGVYVIKSELLDKYNVYFYHYTREEMSKSEEEQRKLRKNRTGLECCPPPILPPFSEPFAMVADLLQCDVMLHLMKIVLERSLNLRARSFSEAQLQKILHLIGYALNEEEQKYATFFQFTMRAEKWGLEKLLEELTKSARVEVHRDLINYILKKYRQISNKSSEMMVDNDGATTAKRTNLSQGQSTNIVSVTPATTESSSSDAQGKEQRAKLAAERRAQIMAQILLQQQQFMKENAALFNKDSSSDRSSGDKADMDAAHSSAGPRVCLGPSQSPRPEGKKNYTLTCMLCQGEEVVRHDGPAIVLAAFIQKSTVLCRSRFRTKSENSFGLSEECFENLVLSSNLGPAPHASTCGHVMHSTCWTTYIESILSKENRRPYRLRQPTSFDIEKNEYLCPLCESLNNTVIPVIPELHTIPHSAPPEAFVDTVSFVSWYEASLLAIKHKRKVDEAIRSNHTSSEEGGIDNEEESSQHSPLSTNREQSGAAAGATTTAAAAAAAESSAATAAQGDHSPITIDLTSDSDGESLVLLEEEEETTTPNFSSNNTSARTVSLNRLVPLDDSHIYMKLRIYLGIDDSEYKYLLEPPPRPRCVVSLDILKMLHLFAQMSYIKGMGTNPHEDDPAIPMMAWKCCAYTVHSTEWQLRYSNKPLLGSFNCRQQDGLENLIRMCGLLGAVWKSKHVVNKLGARLLMMIIDNVDEEFCLIDWDCFGLLVPLTATLPSIFQSDFASVPTGSLLDLHILTLLLLANMAQAIVVTDFNEIEEAEPSVDEDTACLLAVVPVIRDVNVTNTILMWNILKKSCTSFLRSAVIFYHFLTGIPAPEELKVIGGDTYENMCKYLGLPTTCDELLGMSSALRLFDSWASHPKMHSQFNTADHTWDMNPLNELVTLPEDYSELLNTVSLFTCPNSDREDSRNPTMCLVCGEMLCSQTYCCQTELNKTLVGACTYHSHTCGADAGIFLRVRECDVLLLASPNKGTFMASPYLDDYGEPDMGLRRGNPLHLSEEKYKKLQLLWLSHSIHEEIARALEFANAITPIQWQHY